MKRLMILFCGLLGQLSVATAQDSLDWLAPFTSFYQKELGSAQPCASNTAERFRICSNALKNEGNSPYVLHHGKATEKTLVLFHGLSDSPFFFRSIAPFAHNEGYTVIVALLPGHGKKDADADMEDGDLAERWLAHVAEVMNFANGMSDQVYVGGFSTGGALATHYVLDNPSNAQGLLLFSGALALDETVEKMGKVWGMKWLAKVLDGDYPAQGPNPYKYPHVAKHSAFMLTDVIFAIREKMEEGKLPNLPIFAAHSMADTTTLWHGIEDLLAKNQGQNIPFQVEADLDVCHADLVISGVQLEDMQYDESQVEEPQPCQIPKANPKHAHMMQAMVDYLQRH